MRYYTAKIVVGFLCEFFSLFIFLVFHKIEEKNIIEVGYQTKKEPNKSAKKNFHFRNSLFFFDICIKAKYNKLAVWIYFACNLVVCICSAGSMLLCVITVYICEISEIVLYMLGYLVLSIYIWAIPHFVLDLFFLPSAQRRYGIKKKRKK